MYKYIMTVAIVLMGLLQFTSCNDANDWTVDKSVLKQRPPTSFKVEYDKIKTLNKKITIGTAPGAKSYEIQMSEAALAQNGAVIGDKPIHTAIVNYDAETGDLVLDEESSDLPHFEHGKDYYFRVRAIGEDGSLSNWYTNGSLYKGGVSNPDLENKLIENTYKYDGDKNSYSTITIPVEMWVDGSDVDASEITMHWYEMKNATIKYLRNESKPDDLVDISSVSPTGTYSEDDDTNIYEYTWSGLEGKTEYTFSLLADDKETVLGTVTATTEVTPDMSKARSILEWTKDQVISTKGAPPLTITDPDHGDFKILIYQNNAVNAGYTNTGSYKCQNPLKERYTSKYRFQSKNRNELEFEVPSDGRLYLYANGNPTTYKVTQEGEPDQEITIKKDNKDADSNIKFTKIWVKRGIVKLTPTASASCYYYGFVFVPNE